MEEEDPMTEIADHYMREMLARTKPCAIVILKAGPNRTRAGSRRRSSGSTADATSRSGSMVFFPSSARSSTTAMSAG